VRDIVVLALLAKARVLLQNEPNMWTPDIAAVPGPRYVALASAIAQAIESGEFAPGSQLPPQRDLAERLGVTVGTVTRAYSLVREQNLISGEVGRGTFVQLVREPGQRTEFRPSRSERTIDLSCYRVPLAALGDAAAATFSSLAQRAALLPFHKYPSGAGLPAHREIAARWMSRSGLSARAETVAICGGSQQALSAVLPTAAGAGDTVLTEALTYPGIKALANLYSLRLRGVEMDTEGMIPEALRAAARASDARVVYLQPTLHNPAITTMGEERREGIARVARDLDLLLIEDDTTAAILEQRPAPLASLLPDRTIYLTSLAKCLSPALRVGFVACPPDLFESVTGTLHAMSLGTSPIISEVATTMMSNGVADAVMRRMRVETARRRALAMELLGEDRLRSHVHSVHMWLSLPPGRRGSEFELAARQSGVAVVGSDNFAVEPEQAPGGARVSLNPGVSEALLRKGLTVLKQISGRPAVHAPTVI
jgi:DNA-binding transcriptional MocR family regulator